MIIAPCHYLSTLLSKGRIGVYKACGGNKMPKYYDLGPGDFRVFVRRRGIRRLPLIKELPYRRGSEGINFEVYARNKSPKTKTLTYSWEIAREVNGETQPIDKNDDKITVASHKTEHKPLNQTKRLIYPGYYYLKFSDRSKSAVVVEFDLPKVMDSLLAKSGFGAMGGAIGVGMVKLIEYLTRG